MRILILTPQFSKSGGGASQYYLQLIESLCEFHPDIEIQLVTEKSQEPHQVASAFKKRIKIQPILPQVHRFGLNKIYRKFLRFILEIFLLVYGLKSINRFNVLLVHSSFISVPSLAPLCFFILKKVCRKTVFVLDKRDTCRLFGIKLGEAWDSVIACSLAVEYELKRYKEFNSKIVHVPVLIKHSEISIDDIHQCLEKYNLKANKYLFFPNGCRKDKGFHEAFELWKELCSRNFNLDFVVAGSLRDWNREYELTIRDRGVIFIGPIPNTDMHSLYAGSELVVNLSEANEGMPRSCLEAIDVGAKTILPRNVPEFNKYASEYVAASYDPSSLAQQAETIIDKNSPISYPIEKHYAKNIIPMYMKLINAN